MKKGVLLIIISLISIRARAQYAEILKPQSDDLITAYKKNHVSFVNYFENKNGKDSLLSISAIDSSGLILLKRETKSVHYFDYTEKGQMALRLDSTRYGNSLSRLSYAATYNDNGLLAAIELPTGTSVFKFNEEKHVLAENYLITGAKLFWRNIYKFDAALHLISEEYKDSIGRPYKDHSYVYDKAGKLIKEEGNEYFKGNTKNYTGIVYSYNSMGKLSSMQISLVENYGTADDETGERHIPRYSTISESYVYDKSGILIKKIHTDQKNPKLNYTVIYEYYDNGLLRLEQTLNKKGDIVSNLGYTYEFYGK